MKIVIINGSPRGKKSNSEILIKYLCSLLEEHQINKYYLFSSKIDSEIKSEIHNADVLIFSFPLYIDSIPSSLLDILLKFEEEKIVNSKTKIYCIVNNGFFEGKQNQLAILQMKNWCEKIGAEWGQGVGIGAGEILSYLEKVPLGKGPLKNLGKVLNLFSGNIKALKSDSEIYINPNWSRMLYWIQGSVAWIIKSRKNGLKIRDLFRKI